MHFTLALLKEHFGICRIDPQINIPNWALTGKDFVSISRSNDELSIICEQSVIPETIVAEKDWRVLRVEGPIDNQLPGIVYSLAKPLAEAQISIFAITTFDTDYILVKEGSLTHALQILGDMCKFKEE